MAKIYAGTKQCGQFPEDVPVEKSKIYTFSCDTYADSIKIVTGNGQGTLAFISVEVHTPDYSIKTPKEPVWTEVRYVPPGETWNPASDNL